MPSTCRALLILVLAACSPSALAEDKDGVGRIGVIGPESNHSINFTQLINDPEAQGLFAEYRVVAGYPKTQPNIESREGNIPGWEKKMQEMGVELLDSMDDLLKKVDCVMVMANDGHPHLGHALPAMRAGKRIYVDKPVAANLRDVIVLYQAAEHYRVSVFSSSALRFTKTAQTICGGSLGSVLGADTYSPAPLEPTHTDLFWYGIHGVEQLYTVMGAGCQTVTRVHTPHFDVVVGVWQDGRIGTFRGTRKGQRANGGTAFGEKATATFGKFEGYDPLVLAILGFFKSGQPPVTPAQTLEIYAFMEAADESKRRGGAAVSVQETLDKARAQAKPAMDSLLSPESRALDAP